MSRVYLELVDNKWKEVEHSDFWVDRAYLRKLDNLKMIQNKNWDGVIIIDGKERSGKSVLGMVSGWYLSNGNMGIQNFARGLEDAARKIAALPERSILIVDEGSLVFSSKDSLMSIQKRLIKLMDVIGQKNMIFIICLPCFFDLNKTIAVRRSLWLCHVYPDKKYERGRYAFWGERLKKTLFIAGKKSFDSYAFPRAEFIGNFMDFEPPFYKQYLDIVKKESLKEAMDDARGEKKHPTDKNDAALIYYKLKNDKGMSVVDIAKMAGVDERTIRRRLTDFRPPEAPKEAIYLAN